MEHNAFSLGVRVLHIGEGGYRTLGYRELTERRWGSAMLVGRRHWASDKFFIPLPIQKFIRNCDEYFQRGLMGEREPG